MPVRTFFRGGATIAALATTIALLTAVPSHAAAPTINDIDGDGKVDLAYYDVQLENQYDFPGEVHIKFGDGEKQSVRPQELGFDGPDGQDPSFGSAVAVANINGDDFADLLIGANDFLYIAYGSEDGVGPDAVQRLELPGDGAAESIAVIPDPTPLIAVGAPRATVDGISKAGAVYLFRVNVSGKARAGVVMSQNTAGIPETSANGDGFGEELAADGDRLVIGSPDKKLDGKDLAGMIHVLKRKNSGTAFSGQSFHQGSPAVSGTNEAGDWFGYSVDIDQGSIAVGIPGEDIGSTEDAGMVAKFRIGANGLAAPDGAFHQGSAGIPGGNQQHDSFGHRVHVTRPCAGQLGIAIEAQGEDDYEGRITMVNLDSSASCKSTASSAVAGHIYTQIRSAGAVDGLLVGNTTDWPATASETRYPYTTVTRTWLNDLFEISCCIQPFAAPMVN